MQAGTQQILKIHQLESRETSRDNSLESKDGKINTTVEQRKKNVMCLKACDLKQYENFD